MTIAPVWLVKGWFVPNETWGMNTLGIKNIHHFLFNRISYKSCLQFFLPYKFQDSHLRKRAPSVGDDTANYTRLYRRLEPGTVGRRQTRRRQKPARHTRKGAEVSLACVFFFHLSKSAKNDFISYLCYAHPLITAETPAQQGLKRFFFWLGSRTRR